MAPVIITVTFGRRCIPPPSVRYAEHFSYAEHLSPGGAARGSQLGRGLRGTMPARQVV